MEVRAIHFLSLQADDASNKQRWVGFIQDLNEHSDYNGTTPTPGIQGPPSPPQKPRHLQPPSPNSALRRMSSPVNTLSTTASKSSGFLSRIRKTLTRKQTEQDDYSSYTTFQQPLHNCPVSPDNKVCNCVCVYVLWCVYVFYGVCVYGV